MVGVDVIVVEPGMFKALLSSDPVRGLLCKHLRDKVLSLIRNSVPVCWIKSKLLF